jgi:hypothetical protein
MTTLCLAIGAVAGVATFAIGWLAWRWTALQRDFLAFRHAAGTAILHLQCVARIAQERSDACGRPSLVSGHDLS